MNLNVLNIIFNIDEIYLCPTNFLMKWMAENLPDIQNLPNKEPVPPCDASSYFLIEYTRF